ncbi:unnamed protein product [Closterium sp. NIES-53]
MAGMRPDEELGSLSWQVHLSKFVATQTAFLQAAVGKFSGLKGRPTRGHWLKSRDLVTVTLVKRADPKLCTISLICGVTYVRKLATNRRASLMKSHAIPSRVVVACYTAADSPSQLQKFMMRFETAAAAQSFSAAIQGLMNDEKEANLHSCVTQPSQPQSAVEEALPLSIQLQACILDPTFQEFVHQVETVWNQLQENLAPELANQALLEQAPQQP